MKDMGKGARPEKRARIFVISAPSGCGKTTLVNRLLKDNELDVLHSVSLTTRRQRLGERNSVDYRFVSKEEFGNKVKAGYFLEWEENFGSLYGTPKDFVRDALKKGYSLLLSIDVKGAMKVKKAYPSRSVLIFLSPPSLKSLKERLLRRKTDNYQDISHRLEIAKKELYCKDKFDYLVINDALDNAYRKLKEIILAKTITRQEV